MLLLKGPIKLIRILNHNFRISKMNKEIDKNKNLSSSKILGSLKNPFNLIFRFKYKT